MFCDFRHGFDCLRGKTFFPVCISQEGGDEARPHPTPGRTPTRDAPTGEEGRGAGLFGCGVWVCIVSVGFWVGDGRRWLDAAPVHVLREFRHPGARVSARLRPKPPAADAARGPAYAGHGQGPPRPAESSGRNTERTSAPGLSDLATPL